MRLTKLVFTIVAILTMAISCSPFRVPIARLAAAQAAIAQGTEKK